MRRAPRKKASKRKAYGNLCAVAAVFCCMQSVCIQAAQANAQAGDLADADIPEEILRTEIIVEARSPLTGELLTAAEYAQLQASLDREGRPPQLSSDIRQTVYLLRLRRILQPIIPFL